MRLPKIITTIFFLIYFLTTVSSANAVEVMSPSITVIPAIYYSGSEVLHIEGQAAANSTVQIALIFEGVEKKNFVVQSGQNGTWVFFQKLSLEKGIWEVKARNVTNSEPDMAWSTPATFLSIPNGIIIGDFNIKFSIINMFILLTLLFTVVMAVFLVARIRSVKKQVRAFRAGSTETLIKGKIDGMRKDVTEELWRLEKKLKKNGTFTDEESLRREKLLRELKKREEDVEEEIMNSL